MVTLITITNFRTWGQGNLAMLLTNVQIANIKALLFRQVMKQRTEVGIGQAQRVTT